MERHADHFKPGVPDEDRLTEVAAKRWIILAKDEAIGRNPLELAAVKRS